MRQPRWTTRPLGCLLAWALQATGDAGPIALFAAALLPGCANDAPAVPQLPTGAIDVERVDWSEPLPAMTQVGRVAAVAEAGDDTALFSDNGVFLWSSGGTAGSDGSLQAWRSAASVPALGLLGKWLLGVDSNGHVYRVQSGASFGLEDVTDRYLLTDQPVYEVIATRTAQVVFALADKVAVTDGVTLQLYDVTVHNLVGGPDRVAGYDAANVVLFDPQSGGLQQLPLAGVVGVAFAPDGTLWAATATTLYTEQAGTLLAAHQFSPPQEVTGLAGAGSGIWVGLGDTLALLRDAQLLLPPNSLALPTGARLLGSPSGDVWILSSSDGSLSRYGEPTGGGFDLELWRQNMLPIFNRLCQSCHLPAGSANLDLSTYGSWTQLRVQISARVVDQKPSPMPPASAGVLTPAELASVKQWVARMPLAQD